MKATHTVPLYSNEQGKFVSALQYERIDDAYARQVDALWLAHIEEVKSSGHPLKEHEHDHWRWQEKVNESAHLLSCPTIAIECDGKPQGLMLLITDGHFSQLPDQKGRPIVYVTYLACAPWNQSDIEERPRFKGVGTLLIRAAVEVSFEVGFKGRIGLHSLPQAEIFYEKKGFDYLGIDAKKGYMKYYELSQNSAAEFTK